jgi:hypothetical protein
VASQLMASLVVLSSIELVCKIVNIYIYIYIYICVCIEPDLGLATGDPDVRTFD